MRHFRFSYIIILICVVLFASACTDEVGLSDAWYPWKSPQSFSVSSNKQVFSSEGGSKTLNIVSDVDWTIVEKPDFVTISPMSGGKGTTMITVSATANNSSSYLKGNIKFDIPGRLSILVEQKSGLEKTFVVGGVTFNMIFVEHGTFQMGSNESDARDEEKPIHDVTISKDFYIGETEVTQGLWYAVMGEKPTVFTQWSSSKGLGDDYPAYYISYTDVQSFIMKLNRLTGEKFRMPTEAEWEYAAKGGNKSQRYTFSGSNTIGDVAWYFEEADNKGSSPDERTHCVATKQSNELGIYDMSGNVLEWCSDWYGSYSSGAVTDPQGAASGSDRVLRGGSLYSDATNCRISIRIFFTPKIRYSHFGFRLALSSSE